MADKRKQPELCMWRIEHDRDTVKKAYVVAIIENLQNSDTVDAVPPTAKTDGEVLKLMINGKETDDIQLPALVLKAEVKSPKKVDSTWHVVIKLKKKIEERWVKWPSPPMKRAAAAVIAPPGGELSQPAAVSRNTSSAASCTSKTTSTAARATIASDADDSSCSGEEMAPDDD